MTIKTVAEFFGELLIYERSKLDEFELSHGPTIGRMYEGLAADILDRVIPPQFNLRVVSGFIFNDSGGLTGEIDCMLVAGAGVPIPYTASFKWHIRDVLAVFEIKKTLYSAELLDSFEHLRGVLDNYVQQLEKEDPNAPVKLPFVGRAFSEITRKVAPPFSEVESLPLHEAMILHALILEHASPVRVVFGHHGFKSEFSFRENMIEIISENIGKRGFGVGSFPQLMVSGNYSLIKANGRPYSAPIRGEFWDFCLSSSENPLVLMLELIWTRLEERFEVGLPWGEDLQLEMFHLFLSARSIRRETVDGWEYQYTPLTKAQLTARSGSAEWRPVFLSLPQFVEINLLCKGDIIDICDDEFVKFVSSRGLSVKDFVSSLLDTGLVAMNGSRIELITEQCACVVLPTGQYVAAENNTGRLTRWVEKRAWESEGK